MRKILTFNLLLFISFQLCAQKKPVDHSVYDMWQTVSTEKLSNAGTFVGYSITPQAGDADFYIKNLKTKTQFNYPRVESFNFSENEKYAAFKIKPTYAEVRQAKIKKKKADDMPKDSLGLVKLNSSELIKIPRIKSFAFPEDASNIFVYLADKELPDTTKKKKPVATKEDSANYFADETPASATSKEGTNLVVKNLESGNDAIFKGVTEYQISKNGNYVMYVSTGTKKDSTLKAGIYIYDVKANNSKQISAGKGIYKNLTFDEKSTQLAFTANKSAEKALVKIHDLYYYNFKTDSAVVLVSESTTGMPSKSSVSENGRVYFSKNTERLFFGTALSPIAKDTTIVDFEVAKLDIWNYKDQELQPMQLVGLSKALKESFLAMVDLKSTRFLQIANEQMENVGLGDFGNSDYAVLSGDYGQRGSVQWEGFSNRNALLINLKTGDKKALNDFERANYQISPKGKFVYWYNRNTKKWFSYDVATGNKISLNLPENIKFYDEENDVPDEPREYGEAGFSIDEKQFLIYDRYDIWSFDPLTGMGKNITNGFGRKNNITLKYVDLNPEEKGIATKGNILLDAFNHTTKQNGFYQKDMGKTTDPTLMVMANNNYSRPQKAKNADVLVYEKSSYVESPDLFVSSNFKQETKLTETNPQQKDYNWGTAELVKWTTPKGYKSEGILYKPEDFDPNKKYPMIVYFYEKLSDGLYNYKAPAPSASSINIPLFVSNGYLVFTPDISYEDGYPGKSAEEFINSGVESLKKNSWVDGSKIGIQGQSWGGYQVAHLITRTNMYAAAWAGAPVVNMFSAYGGVRWGSGMNRQFQYEKTQSRIGATIWEKPELYIENSPLFKLPNVQTPVAIMANDADGSVPWYQGIEMFTALRRLNKPVWLLVYNNEDHNLVQRQNRKDISIREQQFFDHFLKGAPAPVWLKTGVPATEKGKNWGFELTED
jgi:dipeptidyl aminopeptidase/acylaminoacyl peptidase